MTKNVITLLLLAGLFVMACNQQIKETAEESTIDTVLLAVATFDTAAPYYVDQPVWIEGTVTHTCKHGGKRMFIADGNDSILVEITTGPDIVMFDESLVGSRVYVLGVLKEERIDEKYLNEWEAELKKPVENHETGIHTGAKGHEDQPNEAKFEQINSLRKQIKDSGKDHLSSYSIEAISLEEIPVAEEVVIVEGE